MTRARAAVLGAAAFLRLVAERGIVRNSQAKNALAHAAALEAALEEEMKRVVLKEKKAAEALEKALPGVELEFVDGKLKGIELPGGLVVKASIYGNDLETLGPEPPPFKAMHVAKGVAVVGDEEVRVAKAFEYRHQAESWARAHLRSGFSVDEVELPLVGPEGEPSIDDIPF